MHDRGCKVTGVDVDKYIVHGAQMIANILKKQINYYSLDLDKALDIPKVDTVLLFSVLHHTRDIEANAAKIAQACSRVILEVRPIERGSQPLSKGRWERISGWELNDIQSLYKHCETLFPGFSFKKDWGSAGRNRRIIELIKNN